RSASSLQFINGAARSKGFMKYRHQYHAGNFADVHKHVCLLEVLGALTRKDKGLLFVDTHAGRGEYDLHPGDAQHPSEWQSGAARVLAATPRHAALAHYREVIGAGAHGASLRYPRSPLPPPERRGCVLIDPPYEERADFARVQDAAVDALHRFPTGVLVAWLPIKLRADFDLWFAGLERALARPLLASLLWLHLPDSRAALNGSALVMANPPYLLEQGMREWLPELCALLGDAHAGCEVLATSGPR